MTRYHYAIVRVCPRPSTEEFLNVGYVAWGDDDVRFGASEPDHLRKLCAEPYVDTALSYFKRLGHLVSRGNHSLKSVRRWVDRERGDQQTLIQWSGVRAASASSLLEVCKMLDEHVITPGQLTLGERLSVRSGVRVPTIEELQKRGKQG